MKRPAALRAELFTQIGLDSGALTLLGAIAHPIEEPGLYRGSVQREAREVGHFHIHVKEGTDELQVNLDLARFERTSSGSEGPERCDCGSKESTKLEPGGHLLLHVSEGRGGYSVKLSDTSRKEREIYDSAIMTGGDRFLATILRPGRYAITNTEGEGSAELEVAYPERGEKPYVPEDPVTVHVTSKGFRPASVSVGASQGQIYEVETSTRIQIELVEPYDRLRPEGPRFRLEHPSRRGRIS
jgi:hypothetical protein